LRPLARPFPKFHLGLFIFNPYGVGASCTALPQVFLKLFIFNPFGVGAYPIPFPQVSPFQAKVSVAETFA